MADLSAADLHPYRVTINKKQRTFQIGPGDHLEHMHATRPQLLVTLFFCSQTCWQKRISWRDGPCWLPTLCHHCIDSYRLGVIQEGIFVETCPSCGARGTAYVWSQKGVVGAPNLTFALDDVLPQNLVEVHVLIDACALHAVMTKLT